MESVATRPTRTEPDGTAMGAQPWRLLVKQLRAYPAGHALVLMSVAGAVACATGSQYAIKHLVDQVSSHPGAAAIDAGVAHAYLILVGLIVADNASWRIAGWVGSRLFVRVAGAMRDDLFRHLTGHGTDYFINRPPGALASRLTACANACFTIENAAAWQILPSSLAVLGSVLVLVTVNPAMGAVLVAVAALLAGAIFAMARRGVTVHQAYARQAARIDGELVDVIGNMNVVRMFGATLREQERLGRGAEVEMRARERSLKYLEKLRLVHAAVTAVLTAALLGWVLLLWSRGQASPGDIVLVSSLGFTVLHGTRDLAVALVDMTQHVARLSESIATLLVPHDLADAPDATHFASPGRSAVQVELEDVHFAYPGREPVLNGVTVRIQPGQKVGLVGRSGAGKSTVLALLQRLYDVQSGRVSMNGTDIRDLTQDSLRQAIGVVPQDISLFHRTLLENIRYGRPNAGHGEVMDAAWAAGCREFIETLPEGFDTLVGDRGVKLSGGQRQRLAIARAFLKDAPLLLLDEATSALDSQSERIIQQALARLMQGRTVIAIAHRLSTLNHFDRILVFDQGRIVDDGPPAELASRPGPYRDLLRQQTPVAATA